jgi:hypothetical protein
MSFSVTTAFVQQYRGNVLILSQQKGSRLRRAVRDDGDIVGKNVYFDRIGATAATKVTTRHADTPLANTPHSRRRGSLVDYDWGDLIDKLDKVKMLASLESPYAINGGNAMGRAMDDEIIEALGGNAFEGEDGSSIIALPAEQKIVAGATGLTIAKLRSAKEILDLSDVDPDEPRYIVVTPKQITNLLATTEVTSSDFNTVKALVAGQVNTFLGFEFIVSNRLKLDASGDRLCYVWARSGVGLGIGAEIMTDISKRNDKRNATQVYICMSLGATRVEDAKVVEIASVEA